MFAVMKKELKSYFLSPIGYIFIGAFLFMFSIFFYSEVFNYGYTNFEYIFYSGSTVLTFIVPLITMRTFSEERKNGTEQLIMTSPISITGVVMAKFIAAMLVIVITEICTLMYFAILSHYGMPDISTTISTLIGFLLLSMSYISFGMFASTLTENQIIAAVISIVFFIYNWFMAGTSYSLINMFSKFPYGQIDIADTITFVTFIAMLLIISIIILQRRKSVR